MRRLLNTKKAHQYDVLFFNRFDYLQSQVSDQLYL